jgi:hypothetical protein
LILVSIPEPAVLAARGSADTTRRRRNFGRHAQLADPERDWYRAVILDALMDQLPGR